MPGILLHAEYIAIVVVSSVRIGTIPHDRAEVHALGFIPGAATVLVEIGGKQPVGIVIAKTIGSLLTVAFASPFVAGNIAVELVGGVTPIIAEVHPEPGVVGSTGIVVGIVPVDAFEPAANIVGQGLRLQEAAVGQLSELLLHQLAHGVIGVLNNEPPRAVDVIDRCIHLQHPVGRIQVHVGLDAGVVIEIGVRVGVGEIARQHLAGKVVEVSGGVPASFVVIALRLGHAHPVVIKGGGFQPVALCQVTGVLNDMDLRAGDSADSLYHLLGSGGRNKLDMLIAAGIEQAVIGGRILLIGAGSTDRSAIRQGGRPRTAVAVDGWSAE